MQPGSAYQIPHSRSGVLLALLHAVFMGLLPVFVHYGTQTLAPITLAALVSLSASPFTFLILFWRKELGQLRIKKAYGPLLAVTFFVVVIPNILFFLGAARTSGFNTSMLGLTEIIFTLLFTPLIGEKSTTNKIFGAVGVFFGAALILYDGKFVFNSGDLLIVLSVVTYPFGNFFAKRALNLISPVTIIFVRYFLGGMIILLFSRFMESDVRIWPMFVENWLLILTIGIVFQAIAKMIYYESFKRMDISKAITLVMTYPLFSLIALVGFLGAVITGYQWAGIAVMAVGVIFSLRRPSVDPHTTKYAPDLPMEG